MFPEKSLRRSLLKLFTSSWHMQQNRRRFIQQTTAATTALWLSCLKISASELPSFTMNKDFALKILATNWGFPGSLDEYCGRVSKEGYDGIEIWWPMEKKGQDELFAALKKYNLEVGFLTGGY